MSIKFLVLGGGGGGILGFFGGGGSADFIFMGVRIFLSLFEGSAGVFEGSAGLCAVLRGSAGFPR